MDAAWGSGHHPVLACGEQQRCGAQQKGAFLALLAQTGAGAPARHAHPPTRVQCNVVPEDISRTLCAGYHQGSPVRARSVLQLPPRFLCFSFVASPNPQNMLFRVAALTTRESFARAGPASSSSASPGARRSLTRQLGMMFWGWRTWSRTTILFQCDKGQQLLQPAHFVPPLFSQSCQRSFLLFLSSNAANKKLLEAGMPTGAGLLAGAGRRDLCLAPGSAGMFLRQQIALSYCCLSSRTPVLFQGCSPPLLSKPSQDADAA